MRHAPLVLGTLRTLFVSLTVVGEYGCSTSSSLPSMPVIQVGGAGGTSGAATGGTPVTTTLPAAGGTAATGGTANATGGAVACTPNQTTCPSGCVDITSDHANCGSCGAACGATEVCNAGVCGCPVNNSDPDAGPVTQWNYCGVQCFDFQLSATNCGECYNVCAPKRCIAGACGCAATDIMCGTDGACFDPMTDVNNCGACANKCGQDDLCIQGQCVLSCSSFKNSTGTPLTDCGSGTCIDTTQDSSNCGGCGAACPNLSEFAWAL